MNGEHLGVGRLSRGAATLTTIPESAGDCVLTATYVGHGDCGYSYSAPVRLTITSCPSATTLTAEPKSVVVGNAVRLTANVSSVGAGLGGPNGTVEFHADGSLVGAGELYNGSAVFTIRSLGAGEHQITATYLGNTIYGRSVSSPVIVSVTSSAVSVTAVPNSALIGEAVTLTAHVTCAAGVPTGTVRFMNEGIPLGTAPLSADGTARFVTSALGAADHQITATYLGNDVCTQATSPPVRLTVTKGTSTTSVTAFPTAAHPSRPVTLTAQVACNTGAPTGTVDFLDSARRIGTGLITDGTTQLITTDLAVGTHQISASYSGDARCGPSTSPPITVTIFVYGSRG